MMKDELKGKVAIVTGGSRGIGKAITSELVANGVKVAFTFVANDHAALLLDDEIRQLGGEAMYSQVDVRDLQKCKEFVNAVKDRFGRLDILVNNAGVTRDKALMLMEKEDWDLVIDTNLSGVFNMTRAVIVTFMKQKDGCIVNISSVSGIRPSARQVNYSASKAGIIGFTKSLAKEVGSYNIRVNAVAPGFIETDMTEQLNDKMRAEAIRQIPLNRFGRASEVAKAALFLISAKSQYITGQIILIDGGLAI
jgi:3-oxoacyl-[acyl-carrier protein] reductase